jgi:hypothetical protein
MWLLQEPFPEFSVGYNGPKDGEPNGGSNSWWGSALYLNFDPSANIAGQGEYFSDGHGVANVGGLVKTRSLIHLSGNIRIDLTIIPEFRVDAAEEPIF